MYNYHMYTQQEFLEAYANDKVELIVNTGIYRDEVERRLPDSYRMSVVLANGVSIMLLLLAFPLYLIFHWIFAALSVFGSLALFLYFQKLNYRVFVRAQVKKDEGFFNYCQRNAVIRIADKIQRVARDCLFSA